MWPTQDPDKAGIELASCCGALCAWLAQYHQQIFEEMDKSKYQDADLRSGQ